MMVGCITGTFSSWALSSHLKPSQNLYVNTTGLSSSLCLWSLKDTLFREIPLCLHTLPLHPAQPQSPSIHLSFCHSPLLHRFTFVPVCAPWHSFRPLYPSSGDVRPGLIDQAINYPCIPSALPAARLTSRPRPYREAAEGPGCGEGESLWQIVN